MSETSKPVWRERMAQEPDALALAYCAGRDVKAPPPADLILAPFDIWTNLAHVAMLADVGIVPEAEARKIGAALAKLEGLIVQGKFHLDPQLEDIHINVETFVAAQAGAETAGLMHTGRSRNDQALTDLRLFMRQAKLFKSIATLALAEALVERARTDAALPMPGLSHTQPAAVTSLGHLWAAHAQALERDLAAFRALEPFMDQSPLGAAAGFGGSWPLDRMKAAEYLGFTTIQGNSLDCVSSRGELEARFAGAVAGLMNHLSGLAQDLIVLSSPPRRYVALSDAYVTGSSIMPQKRNPDFCEITRAKAAHVHGILQGLLGIARGAVSGYNRDQQWTKYQILDLIEETRDAPSVFTGALRTLRVDGPRMEAAARTEFLNAVEAADFLAQTRELPFRRAHALVAAACRQARQPERLDRADLNAVLEAEKAAKPLSDSEWREISEPQRILARRKTAGSPNPDLLNEELKALSARLAPERARLMERRQRIDAARKKAMARLGAG